MFEMEGADSALLRMQGAIDYIENNLHTMFDIRELAAVAQMSQWHFQRVFHATVGETVKNYIRSRRLSRAATSLLTTPQTVLDIALAAGFDSNEAFTRAFRQQFQLSPRAFRQQQKAAGFPQMKPQIGQRYLQHLRDNPGLQPRIEQSRALHLVGVKADLCVDAAAFDLLQALRPAWQTFAARMDEISGRVDDSACLLCDIVSSSGQSVRVFALACVEVTDFDSVPPGMITAVRPAMKSAIFTHSGSGVAWEDTMHYIFGAWLAASGEQLANAPGFCRFDPAHSPFDEAPRLEYHVALG